MQLDQTDKQILNILQEDAKITNKELSSRLNLSPTAIYERIKKLERNEIIKTYVALLDESKIQRDFVVFCQIRLLQHTKDYLTTFEQDIIDLPEVLECHHISGDYDYLLKVAVEDMEAYRAFMVTKLTTLQYIGNTHSSFVISAVKHTTKHVMEDA
ncbi:Lrp/AsnC family transcriptional regulator [Gilvibacter sediminis]|uniref:Lrp/AsnC family transcriptional regulator n=1 Tax=Gilvibacter sediminis TaxID=379071 RepID=UPI00234FDB22|nr:Lrp/AsnC family transcriptional regulator [Gilvibacter sediminis]MDC7998070.1 Lrp/AsnC family transcriptional regulator [Gilvibacter sediminis]